MVIQTEVDGIVEKLQSRDLTVEPVSELVKDQEVLKEIKLV